MKIRIKVNQPPCAHRILTLKGRYLTLKGIDLRRSRERYTCDACGKPVVRTLNLSGDTEHPALQFEILPQLKIILMQADRRPCRLLHFAGSEKMIEVGMGVENVADGESELVHFVENPLVRPTGIDDDGLLRHWIADD